MINKEPNKPSLSDTSIQIKQIPKPMNTSSITNESKPISAPATKISVGETNTNTDSTNNRGSTKIKSLITPLTASQSNLTKTTSISPQLSKAKSNQPSQPPCKQIKTNPKLLSNPQPNKAKSLTRPVFNRSQPNIIKSNQRLLPNQCQHLCPKHPNSILYLRETISSDEPAVICPTK